MDMGKKKTAIRNAVCTLTVLIVGACACGGCQEAPDQVKENMKSYGDSKQLEIEGVTYCTPGELKNVSVDKLTYKPDNLALPDNIDFSDIQDVGLVTFQSRKKFGKKKDEFAALIGAGSPDWQKSDTAQEGWEFRKDEMDGWIEDNGRFAFFSGKYNEYVRSESFLKIYDRVFLGREECPDITCNLGGESEKLKDVIVDADKWIKEFKYLKDDFTYKARTAFIRKDDDGNDYVELFYQPMYKGVGLSYLTHMMDTENMADTVIVAMASGLDLDIETPGKVSGCVTQLAVDVVSEDMADKVIDFDSALKLVEEKMTGFNRLRVVEVRVEYVLKPVYDYGKESAYDEGIIMEARPVYTFLIPQEYEVNDYAYGTSEEANGLVYINVDMLDGTVTDNFAANSFHGN